jgi:hypothetical protein
MSICELLSVPIFSAQTLFQHKGLLSFSIGN